MVSSPFAISSIAHENNSDHRIECWDQNPDYHLAFFSDGRQADPPFIKIINLKLQGYSIEPKKNPIKETKKKKKKKKKETW